MVTKLDFLPLMSCQEEKEGTAGERKMRELKEVTWTPVVNSLLELEKF